MVDHENRQYIHDFQIERLFKDMIDHVLDTASNTKRLPASESELRVQLLRYFRGRHTKQEVEGFAGGLITKLSDYNAQQVTASTKQLQVDPQLQNFEPIFIQSLSQLVQSAQKDLTRFEEAEQVRQVLKFSKEQTDEWYVNIFEKLVSNDDGLASRMALSKAYDQVAGTRSSSTNTGGKYVLGGKDGGNQVTSGNNAGASTSTASKTSNKKTSLEIVTDTTSMSGSKGSNEEPEAAAGATEQDERISFADFLRMIADREREEEEGENRGSEINIPAV
ncbi:unnamed protein product [Amoebophrya sp. A120]|nr:unnamed protein product [Amoebophrya sp. A120]|eukprot:GSA120T00021991001.1